MDFINKSYAQLADLFKSMTPGARIMTALLLIVVVVSLAYLFNQQVSGGDAYLMGGEMFSSAQLHEMQAAFGKAGLESQSDGARLKVPRGQESKYMAALADAGALPAGFGDYLQKAVAVNSFMVNRVQQEMMVKVANQRELQVIIERMSGVEKAAVHIDKEVKRGFRDQNIITASVSVQPSNNQLLDDARVAKIRSLVASSVAGLKPEAVTIVDLAPNGRHWPGSGGVDVKPGAALGDYAELKRRYEIDWKERIREALGYIPGVLVTTNVELDPIVGDEEQSIEYDAKSVVYESRDSSDNKTNDSGGPGGRPGLAAQGGVNQPAVVTQGGGTKNNEETSQSEQKKAVPSTTKRIVRQGLTPKRVTVSVAVPSSYYEDIWRKQNPTPEGQPEKKPDATALADIQTGEKKKIEEFIVPLLPKHDATVDPFPQVAVTTFFPVAQPPLADPPLTQTALAWLGQYWSTLGLTVVALVSLMMLRSMVNATPTSSSAATAATAGGTGGGTSAAFSVVADDTADSETTEGAEKPSARVRLKRRTIGGPTLRDELADIVREDPDAALAILRTWIGATG